MLLYRSQCLNVQNVDSVNHCECCVHNCAVGRDSAVVFGTTMMFITIPHVHQTSKSCESELIDNPNSIESGVGMTPKNARFGKYLGTDVLRRTARLNRFNKERIQNALSGVQMRKRGGLRKGIGT